MKKQLLALLFSALMVVGFGSVASAAPAGNIATVNLGYVYSNLPEAQAADKAIQAAIADAQKTFQRSVNNKMTEQEVAQVSEKIRKDLAAKQEGIIAPVNAKVNKAIEKVAKANGYVVVIPSEAAVYSTVDISSEVLAAAK